MPLPQGYVKWARERGRTRLLLPRYASDDVRAYIQEEPNIEGQSVLGAKGRSRFESRSNRTSAARWESAVSDAHQGQRRRQWRIDSPAMPSATLAQFILRQSPAMAQALDSLRYHARLLKADSAERAQPVDFSGIIDTDEGASAMPSWLSDGLHNGRTKIGRIVGRRDLGANIGHEVERLALIARQVKYLQSGAFIVVASSEPNAFMRLGHTDEVDNGACFRVGGCHESAPIILGASQDSIVYYVKKASARATIIGRAWGIVGDDGIMWTNGYSVDDAPGGRETFDILYALVGFLIADDASAIVSGAYIDDSTELMYDNGDGKKIGRAPVLYCESDEYHGGEPCVNCHERVDEDARTIDGDGQTWCDECYSEAHIYIDSIGESVPNDDAVALHDGEWALADDAVCLGSGEYALQNECVELHDGEWALEDDAIELHDGEWALADDTIELHDGEFALADDGIRLHDGEYATADDAIELHDGEYALADDAIRLHDGEFALADDVVELSARYIKRDGIQTHTLADSAQPRAYALFDDAIELHDGEFALADDDGIIALPDDVYAWQSDTLIDDDGAPFLARLFSAVA